MPRPSTVLRAVAMLALLSTGLGTASAGATPTATGPQDPLITVHGWLGVVNVWQPLINRLSTEGYVQGEDLFQFDYDWGQSNITTAQELAAFVDQVLAQTGADRVDIVSHSMGGISSRWCIKFDGCEGKVDQWISYAGANQGSFLAAGCAWLQPSCVDMVPGSPMLGELNAGDPTPGSTRYYTFWNWCDLIIWPPDNSRVPGAQDHVGDCYFHVLMPGDPEVLEQTAQILRT